MDQYNQKLMPLTAEERKTLRVLLAFADDILRGSLDDDLLQSPCGSHVKLAHAKIRIDRLRQTLLPLLREPPHAQ